MVQPVILSACRTPIGKFGKSLVRVSAARLGEVVVREAIARGGLQPGDIEEVIAGNVISAGAGQNLARQAAIYAGVPVTVGAFTINKVCGSGLKAVMLAAQAIKAGDADVLVAAGMESMSNAPYIVKDMRWGVKYGDSRLIDSMINDGLWDVYNNYHMGMTGERIAEKFHVSREEADRFSYSSQMKAADAQKEGRFADEIVGVRIDGGSKGAELLEQDECIRADTTVDGLAKLKPAFKPGGVLTAGNSSQLSDGASAVVVASEEKAERMKLRPLARVVGYHTGGTEPADIMEAPIPTVKALLEKTAMSVDEIDLFEHNEAYSVASIVVRDELGIPEEKFNVNGGAIALGHPIGASGARVLTTLIYELKRRGKKRGLATLCLGGGNAVAMIIETV
jgi:acetyl-CoA C-acetyltransferase